MNKQAQLRLHSSVMALLLPALFALCAWLSLRYNFEADLSRAGRHSLSPASRQILAKTGKPLAITAYARKDPALRATIRNFVARFQRAKADISLDFVNPDAVPDEVRQLAVKVNGELVLRYDGRVEHVSTDSEQAFVNALQRLLRGTGRWLAFLDGHGERRPDGKANHDLGEWVAQLKYRGFRYRALNLVENPVIPDNTAVLVIASPLVSLLPAEIHIIKTFLNRGGNLLWLLDPGDKSGMAPIAAMLGVNIGPGVVIDPASRLLGINDPTITLTTARLYPPHPVTRGFNLTAVFPKATAVTASAQAGWSSRPVLQSGKQAWLELGALQGEVKFDPAVEEPGPLTLGLGLERKIKASPGSKLPGKQQRVLVIGDGDFLSNTYVDNSGNMELGLRMINWLSRDDKLITIPARAIEDAQLNMSQLTLGVFGLVILLLLPLGLLANGLRLWWQRKNL